MPWILLMAALTDLIGVGNVTDRAAQAWLRADSACSIDVEHSANSDLSDSVITSAVVAGSGSDFAVKVPMLSLPRKSQRFWTPRVDGTRVYTEEFPRFYTAPRRGSDDDVTMAFISCNTSPNHSIYGVMRSVDAPRIIFHGGDNGYVDTAELAAQRTSLRAMAGGDCGTHHRRHCAWNEIPDDHCFNGNNSHGGLSESLKNQFLQAYDELRPCYTRPQPTFGTWHRTGYGNVQVVALDLRTQRESSQHRYPDAVPPAWKIAQAGTGGRVIKAPSDLHTSIGGSYYVDLENIGVYRIASVNHATDEITLTEDPPELAEGVNFFCRRSSMMNRANIAIPDDQVTFAVNSLTRSPFRWNVLLSSVIFNPTALGSDIWGEWDPERMEQRYLMRVLANVRNLLLVTFDRHFSGIDTGVNSWRPEMTCSPVNNDPLGTIGTWNRGSYENRSYGLLRLTKTFATMTIKDETGAVASGVTPYTIWLPGARGLSRLAA